MCVKQFPHEMKKHVIDMPCKRSLALNMASWLRLMMDSVLETINSIALSAKVSLGLLAAGIAIALLCVATVTGRGSPIWTCTITASAVVFGWMWSTTTVMFHSSPLHKAVGAMTPSTSWRVILVHAILLVKVVSRAILVMIIAIISSLVLDVLVMKNTVAPRDERVFNSISLVVNPLVSSVLACVLVFSMVTMLVSHAGCNGSLYRSLFVSTDDPFMRVTSLVKHSDCVIATGVLLTCLFFSRSFTDRCRLPRAEYNLKG